MQAPTALGGLKITLPYERQDRVSFDTTMAQFEQEEAVLEARNADKQQQQALSGCNQGLVSSHLMSHLIGQQTTGRMHEPMPSYATEESCVRAREREP